MKNSRNPFFLQSGSAQTGTRRYYFLVSIFFFASVFELIFNQVFLFTKNLGWQFSLFLFGNLVGIIFVFFGLFFVRKGRISMAGDMLIVSAILNSLMLGLIFYGLGLLIQLIITLAGIIISFEMIKDHSRVYVIMSVIIAGAISYGMDLLPQWWRTESLSPILSTILSTGILALIGIYVLYNFNSYGLQTRLVFTILGVNLVAVLLIAMAALYLTQTTLINNTNRKLNATTQNLSKEIENLINSNMFELRVQAASPSLVKYLSLYPEQRPSSPEEFQTLNLLNDWSRNNPFFVESYAILDANGINLLDTELGGVGLNESKFTYFFEVLSTGISYSSPILITKSGKRVWYFSAPILNSGSKVIGVIRLRYRAEILQSLVVNYNDRSGGQSFGILLDEYDIFLAHGLEPDLIQRLIIGLPEEKIRELQEINRLGIPFDLLNLPDFRYSLAKVQTNQIVQTTLPLAGSKKLGNGAVANLSNQPWKVIYFQPQATILQPVQSQTKLVILSAEIIALILILFGNILAQKFTKPLLVVTQAAEEFSHGNFSARADMGSYDEIGTLATTLNDMANQMNLTLQKLEDRVQERTLAIEVSAEIGRQLSTILNSNQLVNEVVYQLQNAFGYYHVQIYLLDEDGLNLVLVCGTGEAGKQMLAQGHNFPLGRGLVGQAAIRGSFVLIPTISADANWLPNPLLPETRSEIAVPIIQGEQVLGVLDVQENIDDGLDERDADLLHLIAGQIAASLQNSRLLEEVEQRGEKQSLLSQIMEEIHKTTDIERAIKVAAREIGRATGGSQTQIIYKHRMTEIS